MSNIAEESSAVPGEYSFSNVAHASRLRRLIRNRDGYGTFVKKQLADFFDNVG